MHQKKKQKQMGNKQISTSKHGSFQWKGRKEHHALLFLVLRNDVSCQCRVRWTGDKTQPGASWYTLHVLPIPNQTYNKRSGETRKKITEGNKHSLLAE